MPIAPAACRLQAVVQLLTPAGYSTHCTYGCHCWITHDCGCFVVTRPLLIIALRIVLPVGCCRIAVIVIVRTITVLLCCIVSSRWVIVTVTALLRLPAFI